MVDMCRTQKELQFGDAKVKTRIKEEQFKEEMPIKEINPQKAKEKNASKRPSLQREKQQFEE